MVLETIKTQTDMRLHDWYDHWVLLLSFKFHVVQNYSYIALSKNRPHHHHQQQQLLLLLLLYYYKRHLPFSRRSYSTHTNVCTAIPCRFSYSYIYFTTRHLHSKWHAEWHRPVRSRCIDSARCHAKRDYNDTCRPPNDVGFLIAIVVNSPLSKLPTVRRRLFPGR